MLPSLQPSRPKVSQQPFQPNHQQRRTTHELSQQPQPHHQPTFSSPSTSRPRSQIEAMPPVRTSLSSPPQSFYDAATRHPVFFTNNLRKPPFPIPQIPSHGWSPVANGYIQERERTQGGSGTKL
ncbi:uncharacterized protein M421DRAFT_103897 [Didymella exigua CBS 183.55]|uniref:Uncharacterized protein n=1 Tax=Didymella exigua CBS 183.55 TaxID=1150837 RepID=A0A6A5RCD9_9PLEO|nr:uncharacterized protein M421DRAFT_103897 [Didymella exigua CBS 183.55]KAF1924286.1 hypothetical protein M421DRAFT_103897 [Didymella exigua CBS 183.55]